MQHVSVKSNRRCCIIFSDATLMQQMIQHLFPFSL
ncbi:hypothetical protein [Staphylococcus phage phiSa2wa_st121mssa]|uniref:Uncharacterized protein n=7 Tax=Triavirus TaxID=1623273 RepID=A0A2I6PE93_9CAUD|nr:hypothetical protein KMD34_gp32 [Staphylococcus phage phiSa2wa_st1]YP_010083804.1 hypothetical protein KMD47_gp36 [Staphylococcus phage phiSa2wa_st78]YP_010083870.1 hypothetical protein KMD49_gp35 [Staphylococcus phage phiSa2wa_st121mssa]AUM57988.1 hypothetical protein [Staphylococcus phage phiSa2wa_st72]AUM58123.1 hypothetical protein [Staphylococcus phage phiSa2wa_st80]AUM58194.1 hypothetical protein [Staphylococcus phage phiSa2wa_st93mssa]AUM58260.1 hypothetical protein [Staphylococcus 